MSICGEAQEVRGVLPEGPLSPTWSAHLQRSSGAAAQHLLYVGGWLFFMLDRSTGALEHVAGQSGLGVGLGDS